MPQAADWTERWIEYATYNTCFANWLGRVDALCERFVGMSFEGVIASESLDPHEAFYTLDASPEQFFQESVIPMLESEHGADFIQCNMASLALWGDGDRGAIDEER
jgi:hypothetical protein